GARPRDRRRLRRCRGSPPARPRRLVQVAHPHRRHEQGPRRPRGRGREGEALGLGSPGPARLLTAEPRIGAGPDVRADRVVFRLEDRGYASVRLRQELERPRSGPSFTRADGVWELDYRRLQVDRMEYRIEADGELFPDPHNDAREGDRSVVEFPGY